MSSTAAEDWWGRKVHTQHLPNLHILVLEEAVAESWNSLSRKAVTDGLQAELDF